MRKYVSPCHHLLTSLDKSEHETCGTLGVFMILSDSFQNLELVLSRSPRSNKRMRTHVVEANDFRHAISVGDRIFNNRRQESSLRVLNIWSPTLIAFRQFLA